MKFFTLSNSQKAKSMSRNLIVAIFILVIFAIGGCVEHDESPSEKSIKSPIVSDKNFGNNLDLLANSSGLTLVCIRYWKGWHAVMRNPSTGDNVDYMWDGKVFSKSISLDVGYEEYKDIYSRINSLGNSFRLASIDYSRALEITDSWKRFDRMYKFIPAPSMLAIELNGKVRPIWILPNYLFPRSGQIGVLADSGEIINDIRLNGKRDGLRERQWLEFNKIIIYTIVFMGIAMSIGDVIGIGMVGSVIMLGTQIVLWSEGLTGTGIVEALFLTILAFLGASLVALFSLPIRGLINMSGRRMR